MKELNQKVAYLQGLAAGMELADSKEGKLISEILLVIEEMSDHIEVLTEAQNDLEDYVESIDSDLSDLEDDVYDDEDDEDDDDDDTVEVTCPNCGEEVCFDVDILYSDDLIEVTCPECGEVVFINGDEEEEEELEIETDDEIEITPEEDKKAKKAKK